MTTWIFAIDPGTSGAYALMDPVGNIVTLEDTPTLVDIKPSAKTKEGVTKRARMNLPACRAAIEAAKVLAHGQKLVAYIEQVWANPTDGAIGAFSFGKSAGQWEGLAAGLEIPLMGVPPQTWKAAMVPLTIKQPRLAKDASKKQKSATKLATKNAKKNAARNRAMQLFPKLADRFQLKNSDGLAEVAMIAEYGRRIENSLKVEKLEKLVVDLTTPATDNTPSPAEASVT